MLRSVSIPKKKVRVLRMMETVEGIRLGRLKEWDFLSMKMHNELFARNIYK